MRVWKVPIRLLLGEQEQIGKGRLGARRDHDRLGENLLTDGINREVEALARLRTRRAELRMRIAWLVERFHSGIEDICHRCVLAGRAECDDIEEYVKSLKEEFSVGG